MKRKCSNGDASEDARCNDSTYLVLTMSGLEHIAIEEIKHKLRVTSIHAIDSSKRIWQSDKNLKPASFFEVSPGQAGVGKVIFSTSSSPAGVHNLRSIQGVYALIGTCSDISTGVEEVNRMESIMRAGDWSNALELWRQHTDWCCPSTGQEKQQAGALRFRASCVRDGKHDFQSRDIAGATGAVVLEKFPEWKVDLNDFECEVVVILLVGASPPPHTHKHTPPPPEYKASNPLN